MFAVFRPRGVQLVHHHLVSRQQLGVLASEAVAGDQLGLAPRLEPLADHRLEVGVFLEPRRDHPLLGFDVEVDAVVALGDEVRRPQGALLADLPFPGLVEQDNQLREEVDGGLGVKAVFGVVVLLERRRVMVEGGLRGIDASGLPVVPGDATPEKMGQRAPCAGYLGVEVDQALLVVEHEP